MKRTKRKKQKKKLNKEKYVQGGSGNIKKNTF